MPTSAPPDPPRITSARAVINAASGGVGADAAARMAEIARAAGLALEIATVGPGDVRAAMSDAVQAKPDLLVILAGDGTAAHAADLCGLDGPLLAPLPGGTMNMLPRAIYGTLAWPQALAAALDGRQVSTVSCGEVGGRRFYVAAILGEPALWADAREALRHRRPRLAILRARRAVLRAFSGRLRYRLDNGEAYKAEALTLMCPLTSQAMQTDTGLEAAALDPHDAAQGFRLGLATLMGRWRQDPAVTTQVCGAGEAWAKGRIPVVLDGEPHRLDSPVSFRFHPLAFRVLAPAAFIGLSREVAA